MNKLVVQRITFLFGLIFMGVAICGFIPSLTMERHGHTVLFDVIVAGIAQNSLYAVTGLTALACSLSYRLTYRFLIASGALYGALTLACLLANNALPFFPVAAGNNVLQFAMAVGGLVLGTWPLPKEVVTNVPPKESAPASSGSEPPASTPKTV